jgi:ornithine cyclodeaminase/alanine dehydrogenase
MDGTYITAMRTGATSGVATRYLAREDASTVGVIGAGAQARTQLAAVCEVRPIAAARVFSRSADGRAAYAREMSAELGIEVVATGSAEEAVRGVDIVCTASTSKTPVVESDWIGPGVHINGVGSHSVDARELDAETVRRARVVVDTRDAALAEAGDLLMPIKEGLIGEDHIRAELGEVVTGARPGRERDDEITLFKSQGLAIQDVATAALVYRIARERGVGTSAPL